MFCRKCGEKNPTDSIFCQACGEKFTHAADGASDEEAQGEGKRLSQQLEGRLQVVRKLGAGGMAEVYLAREEALEREVAVKVLPQARLEDEEFVARFVHEARITATLEHPNIIRIYSLSQESDLVYYTMNALKGGSLTQRLRDEGAQPVERIARWGRQICAALAYVHRRGIIVRDLKPDNVLLDEEERAVLTDFGIARGSEAAGLTQMGTAIGTPQYMSPEQALGDPIDSRTDLYALGVMLYLLSTATLPFNADEPASLIYLQVHETPEAPDGRNPEVPSWLRDIILRCMAKDPDERFQSADELADALAAGNEVELGGSGIASEAVRNATASEPTAEAAVDPVTAVEGGKDEDATDETPEVGGAEGAEETEESVEVRKDSATVAPRFLVPPGRRFLTGSLFCLLHALVGGGIVLATAFGGSLLEGVLAQWNWSGIGQRLLGRLEMVDACLGVLAAALLGVGQWQILRFGADLSWRWAAALPVGVLLGIPLVVWGQWVEAAPVDGAVQESLVYGGAGLAVLAPLFLQWLVARSRGGVWWAFGAAQVGGVCLAGFLLFGDALWAEEMVRLGSPWDGAVVGGLAALLLAVPPLFFLCFVRCGPSMGATAAVLGAMGLLSAVLAYGAGVGWLAIGGHRQTVQAVGFLPGGEELFSAGAAFKRWRLAGGSKEQVSELGRYGRVLHAVADPTGRRVLSGLDNGLVVLWDTASGRLLRTVASRDSTGPTAVALGPEGRLVLVASGAGTVRLWNGDTGSELLVLGGRDQTVNRLAFSGDGAHFAAVEADSVRLWRTADGEEVAAFGGGGGAVALAADGSQMLSGDSVGGVRLFTVPDGESLFELKTGVAVVAVALDAEGRRGLSGGIDGTLRLWDLVERREIAEVMAHRGPVRALAFSADGRRALSGGEDGQVYLWDTRAWGKAGRFIDLTGVLLNGIALVMTVVFAGAYWWNQRRNREEG